MTYDPNIVLKLLKSLTTPSPLPSYINILEVVDSENSNFVSFSLIYQETYVNQLALTLECTVINLECIYFHIRHVIKNIYQSFRPLPIELDLLPYS